MWSRPQVTWRERRGEDKSERRGSASNRGRKWSVESGEGGREGEEGKRSKLAKEEEETNMLSWMNDETSLTRDDGSRLNELSCR